MHTPDQPDPKLPRRRLIVRAVFRAILSTTVLVALYYLLPLDQPFNGSTLTRLTVGLLAFAGIAVWQVRTIVGSRYPAVRAFEALGLIVPFYLVLFASTYFLMERDSAANFSQPLTRTDALYFTVTVFTTVGFGDITAKSQPARVVVMVQMLVNLVLLGAGARILLGAVSRGQQRRLGRGGADGPPGP
jgi:hypothetical protein